MPVDQSISEAVDVIGRLRVPALFLDTCAAFDVVRCAFRGKPRVAAITNQVIEATVAGELLLYGPSVLRKESARNRVEVESEARRKARDVDQSMTPYQQVAHFLGEGYPHTTPYSHESLIPKLVALHDRLLATCTHVVPDGNLISKAFARASDNRRPARKGGGANDCLLFEEFRSIAHAVPTADLLILLTTNPASGAIHQEITDDLAGTKALVCLNWDWAASLLLSKARLKSI
jgi:hypothetical protein